MIKQLLFVASGFVVLAGGVLLVSNLDWPWLTASPKDQQPINYEANEGIPKDKVGEKRRDYAVLEAALNDLTSRKNPEYKYHIQNVGPGQEIVIGDTTCKYTLFIDLAQATQNIDHEDARSIPKDVQADFDRRRQEAPRSLADFKPANPDIIVYDLIRLFENQSQHYKAFRKAYPKAWGYVWAFLPGYSRDGKNAVVVFQSGGFGNHGENWVYLLTREGRRWVVQWRHCILGE